MPTKSTVMQPDAGVEGASRRLVLASTSRYRRALLERLGLPFVAVMPGTDETPLPDETRAYVDRIDGILNGSGGRDGTYINAVKMTRPDGSAVQIDPLVVRSVRATLPGEYAPDVQSVVQMGGRLTQGVREDLAAVRAAIRIRGGRI